MTRPAPIIAGIVAALSLLFGAYMGSYYALLEGRWNFHDGGNEAEYRVENKWLRNTLEPAHQLDRLIRPDYWGDE